MREGTIAGAILRQRHGAVLLYPEDLALLQCILEGGPPPITDAGRELARKLGCMEHWLRQR